MAKVTKDCSYPDGNFDESSADQKLRTGKGPWASNAKGRLPITIPVFLLIASLVATVVECQGPSTSTTSPSGHGESPQVCTSQSCVEAESPQVCTSQSCVEAAAFIINRMDLNVDPCQDFNQFTCGRWMKNTRIPDDVARVDVGTIIEEDVRLRLRDLLATRNIDDADYITQAKNLYASCMNTDLVETMGDGALRATLRQLKGWPWRADITPDVSVTAADMFKRGMKTLFEVHVFGKTVLLDQPPSAPSKQFFMVPRQDSQLMAYENLISSTAMLLGVNETVAKEDAKAIVDFNIALAKISLSVSEKLHNLTAFLNNDMTLDDFANAHTKVLDWKTIFATLTGSRKENITGQEIIVNGNPSFLSNLTTLLEATPKRVQVHFMTWKFAETFLPHMPWRYRRVYQVYRQATQGFKSEPPRYDTCAVLTTQKMPAAVDQLYVKGYFRDQTKSEVQAIVDHLKQALVDNLDSLDWMDNVTRKAITEKMPRISTNVGYSGDIRKDFSSLYQNTRYASDNLYENIIRSNAISFAKYQQRIAKVMVKSKFAVDFQAYYAYVGSAISLTAALLGYPSYNPSYPKSTIYGSLGLMAGHELLHGFGPIARQVSNGSQVGQWWSQSAEGKYDAKTQCIVDSYSRLYSKQVNMSVDGDHTKEENVADHGGLRTAFTAYRKWVSAQGREELPLPGLNFTHDQLFFISFGQYFCSLYTDEALMRSIKTGVHSPMNFRANGAVQNSREFSEAFQCQPGSPMSKVDKCNVW